MNLFSTIMKGISHFLCDLVRFKVVSTILFCDFTFSRGEIIHKFDDYIYVQKD